MTRTTALICFVLWYTNWIVYKFSFCISCLEWMMLWIPFKNELLCKLYTLMNTPIESNWLAKIYRILIINLTNFGRSLIFLIGFFRLKEKKFFGSGTIHTTFLTQFFGNLSLHCFPWLRFLKYLCFYWSGWDE